MPITDPGPGACRCGPACERVCMQPRSRRAGGQQCAVHVYGPQDHILHSPSDRISLDADGFPICLSRSTCGLCAWMHMGIAWHTGISWFTWERACDDFSMVHVLFMDLGCVSSFIWILFSIQIGSLDFCRRVFRYKDLYMVSESIKRGIELERTW